MSEAARPRVAVVTPYFPTRESPHRGHSAYQTLLHLQHRFPVEVFVPLATYPSWFLPKNFPYTPTDLTFQPAGGLRAHYFEYPALPRISRPFNGLVCARALRPRLAAFAPDVILNYWLYPEGYAAMREGRRRKIPVVLGAIGSDLNRIPDRPTRWFTRRALAGASFLITVSEHLRSQAIAMGMPPDRARRVINGTDTSLFHQAGRVEARRQLGLSESSRIVLFAGWLSATKGLRELADAFMHLAPAHPDLEIILVGEGTLHTELDDRMRQAGLAARFRMVGHKLSAELARWLAAADIFCLPSWAEGCPNVVVEALASGRPVVSTRVGGIPELIDSPAKGILCQPRDAQALAGALSSALSQAWDETAIATASRRDWAQCAIETGDIIEEVWRAAPAPGRFF